MSDEGRPRTVALNPAAVAETLREVARERASQHRKWGQQDHPNGTGRLSDRIWADVMREQCEHEHAQGIGTWRTILAEEVAEAFAEEDPAALRAELILVAAVAAAWVEAIDRATADARNQP